MQILIFLRTTKPEIFVDTFYHVFLRVIKGILSTWQTTHIRFPPILSLIQKLKFITIKFLNYYCNKTNISDHKHYSKKCFYLDKIELERVLFIVYFSLLVYIYTNVFSECFLCAIPFYLVYQNFLSPLIFFFSSNDLFAKCVCTSTP